MRSLDACKAEIFRRSEIKIKQQKKVRNRVLAACVPVCLCVVIGAAGAFPAHLAQKAKTWHRLRKVPAGTAMALD